MERRTIHPDTEVLDAKAGLVEYVASDEALDADGEIMRAKGARFDRFQRNAPFVNNHRYDSIEHSLSREATGLGREIKCAFRRLESRPKNYRALNLGAGPVWFRRGCGILVWRLFGDAEPGKQASDMPGAAWGTPGRLLFLGPGVATPLAVALPLSGPPDVYES